MFSHVFKFASFQVNATNEEFQNDPCKLTVKHLLVQFFCVISECCGSSFI